MEPSYVSESLYCFINSRRNSQTVNLSDRRSCVGLRASGCRFNDVSSAARLGTGGERAAGEARLLRAPRARTAAVKTVKTTRPGSARDQGDIQQLQAQQTEKSRARDPACASAACVYNLSLRDHMRLIDTSLKAVVLCKRCQP